MESIFEHAPAKINLTLQVVGRRDDGYHLLRSLVGFAGVGDLLYFSTAKELSLKVTGPFAEELKGQNFDDNLVLQAARKLMVTSGVQLGAEIHLIKNLPIASGIGGGSADAAATLRGLIRLWELHDFSEERLGGLALELGADVPVCLKSTCSWMEGIGERLEQGPELPNLHSVLLNPGVGVSTPKIFQNLKGSYSSAKKKPVSFSSHEDVTEYLRLVGNDLEIPACRLEPVIVEALAELTAQKSCLLSAMSGSGATCFGLFASAECAQKAAHDIKLKHSGWWLSSTAFY
ncbi:4-(cytidine 5'-diphospho)-2-C-methyl-D-erythritol kinase [Kiloniella antarctica]|uniref:4-diphosphocytidyl-2-C-methyl-D-erythritol kinase n=1 Tax=Kiloniella antarctica TaxID=1550907 RepID=A0ABW5BDY9_9PROT